MLVTQCSTPDMGPKNSAAVRAKDLSWIDRMYLKLENMCIEVDKNPAILLQETSKYMEGHMNVVGANVKKLCSELIQDLISQPILSPEGAEKLPECAIHYKCNCLDLEKPKQKVVDTVSKGSNPRAEQGVVRSKGFEGDDKRVESILYKARDSSKGGDVKVETRHEELATQKQDLNGEDVAQKSEVSGKEVNNGAGTNYVKELNPPCGPEEVKTLEEAHEGRIDEEDEEQLSLSSDKNGEGQDDHVKAQKSFRDDESGMMGAEKAINAVGEVVPAEQTSKSKENNWQELQASTLAQSSEMAVDGLHVTNERRTEHISKVCMDWHAALSRFQRSMDSKAAMHMKMNTNANSMDWHAALSRFQSSLDSKAAMHMKMNTNANRMDGTELKESKEVVADLQSMYSYVFSELSRPKEEEEDPMIMSDFVMGEDDFEDEEQSAHWFEGEDLKKALQTEDFCTEKPQQTQGSLKEYDSDWELL